MSEPQHEINPFDDGSALHGLRGVPTFEEALARLLHTAEHGRPLGIVRGPGGSGKTALMGIVADEMQRSGNECGQIDLRRTSADEFAWRVACELGAAPSTTDRSVCWRLAEDTLTGRSLSGRPTVLLLDHLGECDPSLVIEARRLMASVEASAGWCTVLCAARSESHGIDAFAYEHAELRIELGPLDSAEAGDFLTRVAAISGCATFADDAVQTIHSQTNGLLRDMIRLARLSLLAIAAERGSEVTADIVRMVAGEVAPLGCSRLGTAESPVLSTTLAEAGALSTG